MKENKLDQNFLRVTKLKNGSVLDHLKPGSAFNALKVLGLSVKNVMTIGINYDSKKYGKKDIIKIENKTLTHQEINKLSLVSPHATYCIIKDYKIIDKIEVSIPDIFENIIKCPNPKCITNVEPVETKFYVLSKTPLTVKCYHCEKIFNESDINVK